MAGGVYFTEYQPGRWGKKNAGHLPNIKVIKNCTGSVLKVVTPHEMNAHEHYIIKHVVLDHEFNFIADQMFDPTKNKAAISEMSVGTYRGRQCAECLQQARHLAKYCRGVSSQH